MSPSATAIAGLASLLTLLAGNTCLTKTAKVFVQARGGALNLLRALPER